MEVVEMGRQGGRESKENSPPSLSLTHSGANGSLRDRVIGPGGAINSDGAVPKTKPPVDGSYGGLSVINYDGVQLGSENTQVTAITTDQPQRPRKPLTAQQRRYFEKAMGVPRRRTPKRRGSRPRRR